jgi:hypothetical protein
MSGAATFNAKRSLRGVRGRLFLPILLISAATAWTYRDVGDLGFTRYETVLLERPDATQPFTVEAVKQVFTTGFFGDAHQAGAGEGVPHYWRPMTTLSYMADHALVPGDARTSHIHSLVIHGLVAIAALVLMARIWMRGAAVGVRGSAWIFPTAAVLWWALNPVRAEAVAAPSARSDLYAVLYLLCGLICLDIFQTRGGVFWWMKSLGLFAAACCAKEIGFVFPLIALAFDMSLVAARGKRLLTAGRVMWYVAAIGIVVGLWMLRTDALSHLSEPPHTPVDLPWTEAPEPTPTMSLIALPETDETPRALTQMERVQFYIFTATSTAGAQAQISVDPRRFTSEYQHDTSMIPFVPQPTVWGVIALIGLMAGTMIFARRKVWPLAAAGAAFGILTYLPASGFAPVGTLGGDRFLYGPGLGLAIALVGVARHVTRVQQDALIAATITVLMFLAPLALWSERSTEVAATWKNDATLLSSWAEQFPDNARAQRLWGEHQLAQAHAMHTAAPTLPADDRELALRASAQKAIEQAVSLMTSIEKSFKDAKLPLPARFAGEASQCQLAMLRAAIEGSGRTPPREDK